ncbi:hypothetical protein CTI12_AA526070 [Artemisia annua]|uniref:Uncharacterized protein n=1 Tax=Artemisia annua TaxID=35608 RepID=A0A2U1L5G2_ARTAN|nr:hypothetical protein CTI12_AA526070 [Artemisia annua]
MARKGNPISVRFDLNRLLLLITLFMLFYLLCLSTGGISFFFDVVARVAGFIGVKALSSKMGCSSALAFVIGCAFRALVTAGIGGANMVSDGEIIPSNSGSGGPSHSNSWTEDSFSIGVLMEPFSETEMEGTSVHSSVARDEAGPSHQGRDEAGPSHEGRGQSYGQTHPSPHHPTLSLHPGNPSLDFRFNTPPSTIITSPTLYPSYSKLAPQSKFETLAQVI